MVWCGDWPVVNPGTGRQERISPIKSLLDGLSKDEQEVTSNGNAP